MDSMTLAKAGGEIIGNLVGAAIGSLIGALIIQLAARIVVKVKQDYGTAYAAAFLGYLVGFIIGFVLDLTLKLAGFAGMEMKFAATAVSVVLAFFAGAGVNAMLLRNAEGERINYGQACLISLIQVAIGLLIAGAILFLIFILAAAFKAAS
ncbi:MAG TPA: hypothetical protein PLE77_13705 [Kiritimatiellia bacterium]|nr:hypothetical protein [Kiritimatiellia bacterium]